MIQLSVLLERAGVDLTKVKHVRRYPDKSSVDLWDFSSPASCQLMIDTLVTMRDGEPSLLPTGQQLFDLFPAYVVEVTAAADAGELKSSRVHKLRAIQKHVQSLVEARIPALADSKQLDLLRELWPMLDATKASAAMLEVKNIVQHLAQVTNTIKTATLAQVRNYDPTTDNNWI